MTTPDLLRRTFPVDLEPVGDGRTLEGLCVPFDTPAWVADPPDMTPYQEQFSRGAFDRAVKAPNRVLLNFEHRPGISNVLGAGVSFDQRTDGLWGQLAVDEGPDGEKALRLYRAGVLTMLSVEFKPMTAKAKILEGGIVARTSVHLDAVALCRQGAYPEAQVAAVRTDPLLAAEERPLPFPEELAAMLGRIDGVEVPDYLKAHPAEPDTPSADGTPDSAAPARDE